MTTIKSSDKVKVFTVRGTAFEPALLDGSGVAQENGRLYLDVNLHCRGLSEIRLFNLVFQLLTQTQAMNSLSLLAKNSVKVTGQS